MAPTRLESLRLKKSELDDRLRSVDINAKNDQFERIERENATTCSPSW